MAKNGRPSEEMLSLRPEPPPIRIDPGGSVRVGKSRIGFDLVVEQFESGMTPDDLVEAYDTLELADVYAAIGYYLRHKDEVRSYLTSLRAEADARRIEVESKAPQYLGKNY